MAERHKFPKAAMVYLSEELHQAVKAYAKKNGTSIGRTIREAVIIDFTTLECAEREEFIERYGDPPEVWNFNERQKKEGATDEQRNRSEGDRA